MIGPYATLLILLMGHDDYRVRESATRQFANLDVVAYSTIKFGIAHKDPEIRWRLRKALTQGNVLVYRDYISDNTYLYPEYLEAAHNLRKHQWIEVTHMRGSRMYISFNINRPKW